MVAPAPSFLCLLLVSRVSVYLLPGSPSGEYPCLKSLIRWGRPHTASTRVAQSCCTRSLAIVVPWAPYRYPRIPAASTPHLGFASCHLGFELAPCSFYQRLRLLYVTVELLAEALRPLIYRRQAAFHPLTDGFFKFGIGV
jgi:hypothetical protein